MLNDQISEKLSSFDNEMMDSETVGDSLSEYTTFYSDLYSLEDYINLQK